MDLTGVVRLIVCLLLELFNLVNARTLKMANVLYRHGDRAPIVGYPTDQHKESAWPDGYGQLTQLGMRMEYKLGQFLRTRYVTNSTFSKPIYMHKLVHIRSSNSDRCLMSAESQLAGLYPPIGHQIWKTAFPWQPIPVHTVPSDDDPMLRPWDCVCPRLAQLQMEQKTTSEYQSVMASFKEFFKFLTVKAGEEVTFDNVWQVSDALYCEKQHGLKLPDWATPGVIKNLTFLDIYSMKLKTGNDEFSRLSAGPLLAEMVDHMKLFVSGQGKDVPVLSIYSAHDTTVVPLLGAMNVYDGKPPPYASAVLVEMYQESDQKYTVDILYRNNSARPPYKLRIPNCADPCPVGDFFRLTKNRVSVDRAKECGAAQEEKHITMLQAAHDYLHNNIGLVVGLGIVVVLMLVILIVLIIQCRKNSEGGYSKRQIRRYNLQDTDEEESDSTVLLKG